jgi:hypothetical protein
MARFKDFGAPFDSEHAEKIVFKIYDEEFECYPQMQGKILLEFVKKSASEDTVDSVEAIESFFGKVLLPESAERFDALARDPNRVVSVSTLAQIVSWVMEEYSDRPLEESKNSPSGE